MGIRQSFSILFTHLWANLLKGDPKGSDFTCYTVKYQHVSVGLSKCYPVLLTSWWLTCKQNLQLNYRSLLASIYSVVLHL